MSKYGPGWRPKLELTFEQYRWVDALYEYFFYLLIRNLIDGMGMARAAEVFRVMQSTAGSIPTDVGYGIAVSLRSVGGELLAPPEPGQQLPTDVETVTVNKYQFNEFCRDILITAHLGVAQAVADNKVAIDWATPQEAATTIRHWVAVGVHEATKVSELFAQWSDVTGELLDREAE
jgi:hypothetical protein